MTLTLFTTLQMASAMSFFAAQRTRDGKGVTIPSQIRYINYFEKSLRAKQSYSNDKAVKLAEISLSGLDIPEFTEVLHFQLCLQEICFSIKMELAK